MVFRTLGLICLLLTSCSVGADLSNTELELCIAMICDPHRPCQIVLSTEACYSGGTDLCDTRECTEENECRFGSCVTPDLNGSFCELDIDCARDKICVIGFCTKVENYLDSII